MTKALTGRPSWVRLPAAVNPSRRLFALLAVTLGAACSASAARSPAADDPASAPDASPASIVAEAAASAPPASPEGGPEAGSPESPEAASGPPVTTVRVHYPAGSHSIALRGSVAPWSWDTGAPMTAGPNDTFTLTSKAITSAFQFKPMLDDATWSLGPNYNGVPGGTVDVYPRFTQVAGTWSLAYQFTSTILGNTRGIYVYLPPTYLENTLASMPVVYMHDGQNLFDPAASFDGQTWQVPQAMDAAAMSGDDSAEAIVVGASTTPLTASPSTRRSPTRRQSPSGGDGDAYLQMIVEELKPHVDQTLRTIPDRDHTTMIGSSLGGLITAYAGVTHADVFGQVGALSPSTWWDSDWLLGDVGKTPASPRPLRVYVDSGNAGPSRDDVTQTRKLAAEYRTLGYKEGTTLDYLVQNGGQHSETYWAERLPGTLAFLLGPGR